MAQTLAIALPFGYIRMSGDLSFDVTKTGKAGMWDINQNDPYAVWSLTVSYNRAQFADSGEVTFDDIYSFFLVTASAFAFKVDDPLDNTDFAQNGEGHILLHDGVYRAFKRYKFGDLIYDHPVTRLKNDTVLSGGAAGGTIDPETGIVTGIDAPGRWAGGFYRCMIFDGGLKYETDPSGRVRAFDVPLQENLEI